MYEPAIFEPMTYLSSESLYSTCCPRLSGRLRSAAPCERSSRVIGMVRCMGQRVCSSESGIESSPSITGCAFIAMVSRAALPFPPSGFASRCLTSCIMGLPVMASVATATRRSATAIVRAVLCDGNRRNMRSMLLRICFNVVYRLVSYPVIVLLDLLQRHLHHLFHRQSRVVRKQGCHHLGCRSR